MTNFSTASDPSNLFASTVPVTNNSDGSFTLELATSAVAPAAEYTGATTLKLCSDASCSTTQPVASVSTTYDVRVMAPTSNWPGDHMTPLTAWNGVADWQTFQGNSAHTGFVPVTISPDQLITRWQHGITTNLYFNSPVNLATVTTSNGLFYIAGGNLLQARRESDASLVWQYDFSPQSGRMVSTRMPALTEAYTASTRRGSNFSLHLSISNPHGLQRWIRARHMRTTDRG